MKPDYSNQQAEGWERLSKWQKESAPNPNSLMPNVKCPCSIYSPQEGYSTLGQFMARIFG